MEQNNDGQAPPNNAREARRLSIQRCNQALVHACQCRNANCSLLSCQKKKRVVQHTKGCKRKTNGGCPVCKQFIALCCYHAKHCQENRCSVPFCLNIKHKLRQRQLQQQIAILRVNMEQNNDGQVPPNNAWEARRLSIQRCIQALVHACQCRNANCSLLSCQKMKRVVQHTKGCKRKTNGGCPVCKQLIALCCYHAKHCQENRCSVPFCLNIKHKLQQRLQQAQIMQRRIARMQNPRFARHRA